MAKQKPHIKEQGIKMTHQVCPNKVTLSSWEPLLRLIHSICWLNHVLIQILRSMRHLHTYTFTGWCKKDNAVVPNDLILIHIHITYCGSLLAKTASLFLLWIMIFLKEMNYLFVKTNVMEMSTTSIIAEKTKLSFALRYVPKLLLYMPYALYYTTYYTILLSFATCLMISVFLGCFYMPFGWAPLPWPPKSRRWKLSLPISLMLTYYSNTISPTT